MSAEAVAAAATAYINEVENPAPDLLHRARLRDELATAVHQHEEENHA